MVSPDEIRGTQIAIKKLKQRITEHTTRWKLGEREEKMLRMLLQQADTAEAEGDFSKALKILSGLRKAFHIKEGIEDRRTSGVSSAARRVKSQQT